MSRNHGIGMAVIASLLVAGSAMAQTAETSAGAGRRTTSDVTAGNTHASSEASAEASAAAKADAERLRHRIAQAAAKTSTKAQAKAESRLDAVASEVAKTARAKGEAVIAARLAAEFGTTAEALAEVREAHDASWGNLMIACAIASNANTEVTVDQLLTWKHDGMGWGELGAGLGLELGSLVSSAKAEGMVAQGLAKADGRVAPMHGEGARAGVGAEAGLRGGVGSGAGVGAGASAGAGLGVKIGR